MATTAELARQKKRVTSNLVEASKEYYKLVSKIDAGEIIVLNPGKRVGELWTKLAYAQWEFEQYFS